MRRAFILKIAALAAAGAALGAPAVSMAEGWPTQSIKLVVPYSPGGLPDTVARFLAPQLQAALHQPVVVDNRAGGGGAIAAAALALAPADGYTVLVTDGPMLAVAPLISKKPAYDATKDFTPVSLVGVAPLFLALHPSVKASSLDELVALAKAKPGTLNYGSSGIGSIHHLTAEAFKAGLGLSITHVPFRGSANSVPAMVGGQVDMVFSSPPSLTGFVKSGQARVIAINSAQRSAWAPEVPAIAEKLPGFDFAFNVVVLAKTGTPPEVVQRLSQEIAKAVKRPEVIAQMKTAGVEPVGGSPAQLATALDKEFARMRSAAKAANLQPE